MLNVLRKIGGFSRRRRVGEGDPTAADGEIFFEGWSFNGWDIMIHGESVNQLVDAHQDDISFLSAVSIQVDQYREYAWQRGVRDHEPFNDAIHGLQTKVLNRLGHLYDVFTSGVRYELADGLLWINNVDVRAVINLYRLRPTHQARGYLVGLRQKLALILAGVGDSHVPHGVTVTASQLFAELSAALATTPAAGLPLLVAHPG